MRITLVHPAGFNFVPGQPDFSVLANRMPPIGIMQLASWLEKFGHEVQLHDCLGPYAPPGIETNAEIILDTQPEMVGPIGDARGHRKGHEQGGTFLHDRISFDIAGSLAPVAGNRLRRPPRPCAGD